MFANDFPAFGALAECARRGVGVPGDLARDDVRLHPASRLHALLRAHVADAAHEVLHGEQLLNPVGFEKEGEKGGKKAFPMPADGGVGGLRPGALGLAPDDVAVIDVQTVDPSFRKYRFSSRKYGCSPVNNSAAIRAQILRSSR